MPLGTDGTPPPPYLWSKSSRGRFRFNFFNWCKLTIILSLFTKLRETIDNLFQVSYFFKETQNSTSEWLKWNPFCQKHVDFPNFKVLKIVLSSQHISTLKIADIFISLSFNKQVNMQATKNFILVKFHYRRDPKSKIEISLFHKWTIGNKILFVNLTVKTYLWNETVADLHNHSGTTLVHY